MIDVFKTIKHKYDYKAAPELIYNKLINKVTRANDFRLSKN